MTVPFPNTPVYSQQEYATAFLRLLPTGLCWPAYGESQLAKSLYPLSALYHQNNQLAADLLVDTFPASTVQTSSEWLLSLGLPGQCRVGYDNITDTQTAIIQQLTDNGGCSEAYFIQVAAQQGFAVTVETFVPARITMPIGTPLYNDSAAFTILLNITSGSPASLLQCEMTRRLPAHLRLFIRDLDGSVLSPPSVLFPNVSWTINAGIVTFRLGTPMMQAASVDYAAGFYNGTATFLPGQTSVAVVMDTSVISMVLSNPKNASLA